MWLTNKGLKHVSFHFFVVCGRAWCFFFYGWQHTVSLVESAKERRNVCVQFKFYFVYSHSSLRRSTRFRFFTFTLGHILWLSRLLLFWVCSNPLRTKTNMLAFGSNCVRFKCSFVYSDWSLRRSKRFSLLSRNLRHIALLLRLLLFWICSTSFRF